jgi:glutamate-1-semialdehyde 2,1-aminomutase
MYQAGTLSGNPLAMTAGIATLRQLQTPGTYERLSGRSKTLAEGIEREAKEAGVILRAISVGSMWGVFFTGQPVTDYASAKKVDTGLYARYFHGMLGRGVYLAPSQFETAFISTEHSEAEVDHTLQAARATLRDVSA